ncbi:MAG: ribosome small subunit-dependent GTPase A [Oscillospiraceae bacterium]|nr:ribosome small subunit-dependent GTPase A [Oscillospiraceae bacterium]
MTDIMAEFHVGQITKGIGGFYTVSTTCGDVVCKARGLFRKQQIKPLPGDMVEIRLLPGGGGYMEKLLPRRNSFLRPPICNVDLLVILASAAKPKTEPYILDKMLIMGASKGVDAVIAVNKCDLESGQDLISIYRPSGIPIFQVSALTRDGLGEFSDILNGKFAVFAGSSGVGKSSLLNALDPAPSRAVGEISRKLGRGRHTTRQVELFSLPGGILAADTPGFASLDGIEKIPARDLAQCFPEFSPYAGQCRFSGCLHGKDLGCAVSEAAGRGDIHPVRYGNYLRMLSEAE